MMFETEGQKKSIQRWSRLATQLNGAAESGRFDHITTKMIVTELDREHIFEFLASELPAEVWDVCQLSDVDRHQLAKEWTLMARAYEPEQFHVRRNGLALLVADILHMIDIRHAVIPSQTS